MNWRMLWLCPVLLALLLELGGCGLVVGSGNSVMRQEDYRDFDRLEIGSAFQADTRRGDSFSVVIYADENVLPYLDIYQRGSTLHIGLQPTTMVSSVTLRAEITMPALASLKLSGASRGTVSGFESSEDLALKLSGASYLRGDIAARDVQMELSGASSVELGLRAGNVQMDLSGASRALLSGSGQDLTAGLSGASQADLESFPVKSARISASGASGVTVALSGRLDVEASGVSSVSYVGNPTLGRLQLSGGSAVKPK